MMTTLLINEVRAHEVLAEIVQAHTKLREIIEQHGLRASIAEPYLAADDELSGAISMLEVVLESAAKTELNPAQACTKIDIRYESRKIGRPAQSIDEKLARIAEIEQQIRETDDYTVKLALGKTKRRILRSIVTSPVLAAQLSRDD
jgi:hypothetical protein